MDKVTSVIPSLGIGGAEALAAALSQEFVRHGWKSQLIVLSDVRGERGIRLRHMAEAAGVNVVVFGTSTPRDFRTLFRFAEALRLFQPKVILSHLPSSEFYVAAAGRQPVVQRRPFRVRVIHNSVIHPLSLRLSPFYHATVACSNSIPRINNVPFERFLQIPNGISVDASHDLWRPEGAQGHGGGVKLFMVGHLKGGLHGQKGVDIAIDALDLLAGRDDIFLHICGLTDADQRQVRTLISERGMRSDNIHLHGIASSIPEKIAEIQPDACLLPSRFEGLPLTLLEYSVMGIPVICSDIPEVHDLNFPSSCWTFFEARSAKSLAVAICQWSRPDSHRILEYRRASRDGFGLHAASLAYMDLFQSLIDGDTQLGQL